MGVIARDTAGETFEFECGGWQILDPTDKADYAVVLSTCDQVSDPRSPFASSPQTPLSGILKAREPLTTQTTEGITEVFFQDQMPFTVLAGPDTAGPDDYPTFRLLIPDDIPTLPSTKITGQDLTAASTRIGITGGTGAVLVAATVDVNEANLNLANMSGTLGYGHGGTGLTVLGSGLQYLRTNAGATAMEWATLTLTSGTVTSVGATAPTAGFTISGSPINTSGTFVFTLANDLAALEGLSGTGFPARTGTDAYSLRTITGSTYIGVVDGNGVSGNPTITNLGVTTVNGSTGAITGILTTSNVSGTTNRVAKFTGTNTIGDSQTRDDGTTVSVGAAAVSAGRFEANKSYTNTSDVNIVAVGGSPFIGWRTVSQNRFALGCGYEGYDILTLLGGPSAANPTTALMSWYADGTKVVTNTDNLYMPSAKVNAGGQGHSFGDIAAPIGVGYYVTLTGSSRYRIFSTSGLGYMDFYTPGTGSNRNFSFATSYFSSGDFTLLKSSTAGGTPTTPIFEADINGNLAIGGSSPAQTLDVFGTARIQSVTGTPTTVIGRNASGDVGTVALGPGLSITSGTLDISGLGSAALSSITAATASNTINSLNFGQTWNWSTMTSGTPFTWGFSGLTSGTGHLILANALTIGTGMQISTTNNSLNSANGLLYVANNGTSTSGMVAAFQSNSNSGVGLYVKANARVGINTTTPGRALDVNGMSRAWSFENVSDAPIVVYSSGAGTGAASSLVQGGGNCVSISFNTGTSPVLNGQIMQVTLPAGTFYTNGLVVVKDAGNVQTQADIGKFIISGTGQNSITVTANGTLSASTPYVLRLLFVGF